MAAALSGQWRHEHGASLVEYALLVALIALITIAAMQTLGSNVTDQIDNIANCIEDAAGAACATP